MDLKDRSANRVVGGPHRPLILGLLATVVLTLSGCPNSGSTQPKGNTGTPGSDNLTPKIAEVYVPGGSFDMGSKYGEDDERPITRQQVEAFFIDTYEVTNAEYKRFLASIKRGGKHVLHPGCPKDKDHTPAPAKLNELTYRFPKDYFTNPKYDKYPVVGVDWYDAYSYAAWAGRRLPSEVEWEYAARSAENREFPWGSEGALQGTPKANYYTPKPRRGGAWGSPADRQAKFGTTKLIEHRDGFPLLAPVGSFPAGASRVGAMDMAGNVWEWTSSVYAPYGKKPQKNAKPTRVLRGGAWDSPSSFLFRSANRVSCDPLVRRCSVGFRTARNAKPGEKK